MFTNQSFGLREWLNNAAIATSSLAGNNTWTLYSKHIQNQSIKEKFFLTIISTTVSLQIIIES